MTRRNSLVSLPVIIDGTDFKNLSEYNRETGTLTLKKKRQSTGNNSATDNYLLRNKIFEHVSKFKNDLAIPDNQKLVRGKTFNCEQGLVRRSLGFTGGDKNNLGISQPLVETSEVCGIKEKIANTEAIDIGMVSLNNETLDLDLSDNLCLEESRYILLESCNENSKYDKLAAIPQEADDKGDFGEEDMQESKN